MPKFRMTFDPERTCREIENEVKRATQIHRGMNSLHEAYAVILEELDEFWEQVKVNPRKLSPDEQALRLARIRNELIQTAAMCVRAIGDLKL